MPPNERVAPTTAARIIRGKRIFQRMVLAVESVESPPLIIVKISPILIGDGPLAKAVRIHKMKTTNRIEQIIGSFFVIGVICRLSVLLRTAVSCGIRVQQFGKNFKAGN